MSAPRYYEHFYNADPMVELTEASARELGDYVVEEGGPMRRYRRIFDNSLDSVIYRGWDDPSQPLAEFGRLALGVRAEIHSLVQRCSHGGRRWRTWYVSPSGQVEKILEPEVSMDGTIMRENLLSPDGKLISYTVYRYAEDGSLLDLVTHAPDGIIVNRQRA